MTEPNHPSAAGKDLEEHRRRSESMASAYQEPYSKPPAEDEELERTAPKRTAGQRRVPNESR
jgi:hypothetical protein